MAILQDTGVEAGTIEVGWVWMWSLLACRIAEREPARIEATEHPLTREGGNANGEGEESGGEEEGPGQEDCGQEEDSEEEGQEEVVVVP